MRWDGQRESGNIEDRRGMPMGQGVAIGGGTLLLVLVASLLLGQNPLQVLDMLQGGGGSLIEAPAPQESSGQSNKPDDALGRFASVVLANTEDTWRAIFQRMGRPYEEPRLVLFNQMVQSGCGTAPSAVGPFYCPADGKLYLDLSFFDDLSRRFGAGGDFGAAYVIAHEVGHHIQNLLGIARQVTERQQQLPTAQANALSVRMELQADCLAGVWGHHANATHKIIEPGDFEEGLKTAAAIGDDRLQRSSTGTVRPESWTHGSSQQRVQWLRRGLETGDPKACDTFDASAL